MLSEFKIKDINLTSTDFTILHTVSKLTAKLLSNKHKQTCINLCVQVRQGFMQVHFICKVNTISLSSPVISLSVFASGYSVLKTSAHIFFFLKKHKKTYGNSVRLSNPPRLSARVNSWKNKIINYWFHCLKCYIYLDLWK